MTKTFTKDDLIRYVYEETSKEENAAIHEAFLTDSNLREKYIQIRSLHSKLDEAVLKPSSGTTEAILSYSRSLNIHS